MFFCMSLHAKLGRNLGFFTSAQHADFIYSINEVVAGFSILLLQLLNLRSPLIVLERK
jgi:hypothetical protein